MSPKSLEATIGYLDIVNSCGIFQQRQYYTNDYDGQMGSHLFYFLKCSNVYCYDFLRYFVYKGDICLILLCHIADVGYLKLYILYAY